MPKPPHLAACAALLAIAAVLYAQIEGSDRGVPPIDSSGSFEVEGIDVDVAAKTAEEARYGGWRLAQRRAWQQLWAKTHGGNAGAPALGDAALDGIVAGIVVNEEQIGATRYVANLGVLFDRARAGQLLGVGGGVARSAPLLVIPVLYSGGTATVFETRTEWQRAWARFRSGGSPIDYVRVSGTGADALLLTAGQVQRRGRRWWRVLLDQYGAADVVVPQVTLERAYPGGPVVGRFSARQGPDARLLDSFTLRVASSAGVPAMLDEGIRRIDRIYSDALAAGLLRPDPTLIIEQPVVAAPLDNMSDAVVVDEAEATEASAPVVTSAVTVFFATPDAAAVTAVEGAVRGTAGVTGATTTSLAIGGTSVMRVTYAGDLPGLRAALAARGLQVVEEAGGLRLTRGGP